jgi:hypothetical protein
MDRRCRNGTYGFEVSARRCASSVGLRNVILRDGMLGGIEEEFTAVLGDFDHSVKMDRGEGERSSHRTVRISDCGRHALN